MYTHTHMSTIQVLSAGVVVHRQPLYRVSFELTSIKTAWMLRFWGSSMQFGSSGINSWCIAEWCRNASQFRHSKSFSCRGRTNHQDKPLSWKKTPTLESLQLPQLHQPLRRPPFWFQSRATSHVSGAASSHMTRVFVPVIKHFHLHPSHWRSPLPTVIFFLNSDPDGYSRTESGQRQVKPCHKKWLIPTS